MASSSKVRRTSPLIALAAVACLALAAIGALVFSTRTTVVELQLQTAEAVFTVLPSASLTAATADLVPLAATPLLRNLEVLSLSLQGDASAHLTTAEQGQLAVRGRTTMTTISAATVFPELAVYGPTRVRVAVAGIDRSGATRMVLELLPRQGAAAWRGQVLAAGQLVVQLQDGEITPLEGGAARRVERARFVIPDLGDAVMLRGGAQASRVDLALAPPPGPGTWMQVLDPKTGSLSVPMRLTVGATEARVVPWQAQLVLLTPDPANHPAPLLLSPNLKVSDLEFFHAVKLEEESFLEGGEIRFPGGERSSVQVMPRELLSLTPDRPLTLRSLALRGQHLELALGGKVQSLRLGPTYELQHELLPSLLLFLYTHQLATLIYTILTTVVGAVLAFFKWFGLFDAKPPSG